MINKYDQEANPSHKHIFLWCWIDSRICILPQQIVSARHATIKYQGAHSDKKRTFSGDNILELANILDTGNSIDHKDGRAFKRI